MDFRETIKESGGDKEFDKGNLFRALKEAVKLANIKDSNALGVILYGSQTHGTARPDSDADLLVIRATNDSDINYKSPARDELQLAAKSKLEEFDIDATFENPTTLDLDWARSHADKKFVRDSFWMLDDASIIIVGDDGLEEEIRSLLGFSGRKSQRELMGDPRYQK
ncbi:hypothetical protein COT97_04140 [Candidatus Falkowbacteria bacterium CG10_big_fil_rev_8_21_14_0_10_39_11]|uniref:Polymerase nucleotidyl transferase domain-containing protein n=1 Tax=Candidatus Falkowbacteria bacterium CG10_big_fil_rev_8_21_14_0_10_39_11 TaxID=1974565 RepID=A0A2H0V464_9BACT|nr:MAG: hypothetical protein COT97_04140 [Candidatus Falkowbacteria bacterium CG10_big_fil_rev_8_21_14_0_10_39_11]